MPSKCVIGCRWPSRYEADQDNVLAKVCNSGTRTGFFCASREHRVLNREQVNVDLAAHKFRPPEFANRALSKAFMGATIQPAKFAIAIRAETELAGATISGAMQKVIMSVPMSPDESLANDLLAIFDSEFEPMIDAIRYCYAEFLPKMGGTGMTTPNNGLLGKLNR